jgi:branched-subunit amino acid transport protein AzlD
MTPRRAAIAGVACLLLAALPRHWLEASMLRHMLLQLPLLVAAGWLLAGRSRAMARAAAIDQHGVTGLAILLFVGAYWMIPRALELSITAPPAEAAKFASLLLLGALLPGSLTRANWIVQIFFLGNFSWMMAIAGIQYQDMPRQLCNAYLLDDQITTGVALVVASIAIAIAWCRRLAPFININPVQKTDHVTPAAEPHVDRHAGPRIL